MLQYIERARVAVGQRQCAKVDLIPPLPRDGDRMRYVAGSRGSATDMDSSRMSLGAFLNDGKGHFQSLELWSARTATRRGAEFEHHGANAPPLQQTGIISFNTYSELE